MVANSPWFNERDRRKTAIAIVGAASTFVGPFAPLVLWGFEWAYDHRDQIFDRLGRPIMAYAADRSTISLPNLHSRLRQPQAELSITTSMTSSARQLGLRPGDPVSR